MAPYLFLFAADVLGHMIADPSYGIQGLQLPNGTILRELLFADDTALFLSGSKSNLDRTLRVLEIYCEASGAKINWAKSKAIWASDNTRNFEWGTNLGLQWLPAGSSTRHLGFPIGWNMPQEDKDSKILQQIRGKLAIWTPKPLSMAARILVSNQVILASIWYLASCTNISQGTLKKAKALVRNYIWSGNPDKKCRARVAWDSAILPVTHGGIKVFDPEAQANALLAKMIIRGLAPGNEPWKALLQHRVRSIQLDRGGTWPKDEWWLFVASKILLQGSPLWQGIWKAWVSVRPGVRKMLPASREETLRQPLFFNENIRNEEGRMWGEIHSQMFRFWAIRGITRVRHLWDSSLNTWRSPEDIYLQVRPHFVEGICSEIFQSIPWRDTQVQPDDWIGLDYMITPQIPAFFHIQEVKEFGFSASRYNIVPGSERLYLTGEKVEIPRLHMTPARTLFRSYQGKVESFNPKIPPDGNLMPWIFRGGLIKELDFDPKEWMWKRKGTLEEVGFFGYSTKRGYRIITDKQSRQPKFDKALMEMGYTGSQRKKFYLELWHPWVPRKVGTMVWLTCNEGLPLAEWRKTIGMPGDGKCNLCQEGLLESPQHTFMTCTATRQAWHQFRSLRQEAGLAVGFSSWHEILTGLSPPSRSAEPIQDDPIPEENEGIKMTVEKPWDILRMSIIWCIWCSKCAHDLRDQDFHLGVALFRAWQLTVQSGLGAYKAMIRYMKPPLSERAQAKIANFTKVWTHGGIFCKNEGGLKWQMAPNPLFLSRELANACRRCPPIPSDDDSGSDPSSSGGESGSLTSLEREAARRAEAVGDELLREIMDHLGVDIAAELDAEEANSDPREVEQGASSESDEGDISLPAELQSEEDLRELTRFWLDNLQSS